MEYKAKVGHCRLFIHRSWKIIKQEPSLHSENIFYWVSALLVWDWSPVESVLYLLSRQTAAHWLTVEMRFSEWPKGHKYFFLECVT
jgi:hypothetical protein